MKSTQKTPVVTLAYFSLFLLIFIDSMGLGLLFPILNSAMLDPTSTFFNATINLSSRYHWYSATLSLFMLGWFFGAAMLGDLSDCIGRKKSLIICLIGGAIGYLLSALGIGFHSLSLVIIGRIIAGLTAGSQSIAQAAVVDLSTDDNKAQHIAYIILSGCLGFAFGPILGALLVNPNIIHWFTLTTPLYAAALLCLLNLALLLVSFQETFHGKLKMSSIRWYRAIEVFISAFKHADIKQLVLVFFVFMFSWNGFFSFISPFVMARYGFGTSGVSLYMACLGCGFSLGSGYLVGFLNHHFSLSRSSAVVLVLGSLAMFGIIYTPTPWLSWVFVFCVGAMLSVAYANVITLFSKQVDAQHQGWVMGVSGSVMALASALSIFFVGFIATVNIAFPLLFACLGLLLTAWLIACIKLSAT